MQEILKALDPRGLFNDVQRAPLAPRPETLAGKTVYSSALNSSSMMRRTICCVFQGTPTYE